ncbi:MAG TPA: sugar phosphate isomerase/epimerase family protein [Bacteroidales bacterium]|nr:sugar phosphate isomerase/epimerase family protein [Bacteroidales bacterium]
MKLSISNIAWEQKYDTEMYVFLKSMGITGLEIAPSRIFPENPYEQKKKATDWKEELLNNYGLEISSMQSIWYGHTERIFGSEEERAFLIEYTKKAILFAEAIGCKNLVFGNPKNRDTDNITKNMSVAIDFFKQIGDFAIDHNTVVSLEANPIIYNTRFLNTTEEAFEMIRKIKSNGIRLNVDLGTIIYNKEDIFSLTKYMNCINHVHISEPYLVPIEERKDLHNALFEIIREGDYLNYISIEMGKIDDIDKLKKIIIYCLSLYNESI